jgi:hypothetical protein
MPTNRTRIRRVTRRKIDAQAWDLWHAIREIAADPVAREQDEPIGRHREYIDLNCQLCSRLGLWWGHMIFPIDAVTPEPPGYIAHNAWQAAAWGAAHHWRKLLDEREL